MTTIGIISDTHGLLRPQAVDALRGAELIIHAGDIGAPAVIAELEKIAPVAAIRGNIDTGDWAACYPEDRVLEVSGRTIYVLHNLNDLDRDPVTAGFDIVVSGHSHSPKLSTVDGVLYLNPGSAGPRRFSLPIAVAKLTMTGEAMRPHIHQLEI